MAVKVQSGSTVGSLSAPVQSALSTSTSGGTFPAATAYYYKVTAVNSYGETVGSNEQTITTGAAVGTNSITVTWGTVTGATSYKIYRGTAAGAENTYYTTTNATTFLDTNAAGTAGTPPATNTALSATTVTFALHYGSVSVTNRGSGDIFFSVDGSAPQINGADNYVAQAGGTKVVTLPPAEPAISFPSATVVTLLAGTAIPFTVEGD